MEIQTGITATTISSNNGIYSIGSSARAKEETLREACRSFESFLAYYILQLMGRSVTSAPILGASMESEWYRGMMYEKVGEAIGRREELGIAKMLYKSLASHLTAEEGVNLTV